VDERAEQLAQLRDTRDQAIRLMKQVRDASAEVGIIFAAAMFEVIDGVPVTASVTVSVAPFPNEDDGDGLEVMAETLRTRLEGGERVEDASIADLPAGRAVRTREVQESPEPAADGGHSATFCVQYLLPIVADRSLVAMTFSTPVLVLSDEFEVLFEAIASSLKISP
jgi:hypothetical protein